MRTILSIVLLAALTTACGGDDDAGRAGRPQVVVTSSILGDIVEAVAGDAAEVDVLMPIGADPHEFAASARQAEAMERADLLVVNGAGFEAGLHDLIGTVADAGTPVFTFTDHVELLEFTGHDHPEEEPAGEERADEHGAEDPHFWTDPQRVAEAATALGSALGALDGVDPAALTERAEAYVAELADLDAEIEATLAPLAPEQRVLVTNHEVFGYFAERYGFEVVGAVVPSLSTNAQASARDLEALAADIVEHGVPAIFVETSSGDRLAQSLADQLGGEVAIVELYAESLGEPGSGADTYIGVMRTNAERIAEALGA